MERTNDFIAQCYIGVIRAKIRLDNVHQIALGLPSLDLNLAIDATYSLLDMPISPDVAEEVMMLRSELMARSLEAIVP